MSISNEKRIEKYEDLAGLLYAISAVARKLARKVVALANESKEGGKTDGSDEGSS